MRWVEDCTSNIADHDSMPPLPKPAEYYRERFVSNWIFAKGVETVHSAVNNLLGTRFCYTK